MIDEECEDCSGYLQCITNCYCYKITNIAKQLAVKPVEANCEFILNEITKEGLSHKIIVIGTSEITLYINHYEYFFRNDELVILKHPSPGFCNVIQYGKT